MSITGQKLLTTENVFLNILFFGTFVVIIHMYIYTYVQRNPKTSLCAENKIDKMRPMYM